MLAIKQSLGYYINQLLHTAATSFTEYDIMGNKMTKAQSRAYTAQVKVAFNNGDVVKFKKFYTTGTDRNKAKVTAINAFNKKVNAIADDNFNMVNSVERTSGSMAVNAIKSNGTFTFDIKTDGIWQSIVSNVDIKKDSINSWTRGIESMRVKDGVIDTIEIAVDAIISALMRDDKTTTNGMITAAANAIVIHTAYIATLNIIKNQGASDNDGGEKRTERFTKGYRAAGRYAFNYVMTAKAKATGEVVTVNKDGYPSYKADKGIIGTANNFSKAIVAEFVELYGDIIVSDNRKTQRYSIKEEVINEVYTAIKAKRMHSKHSLAFINESIPDIVDSGIGGGLNIGTQFDSIGGTFNVISGGHNNHGDTSAVRDACNTRQRNGVTVDMWVFENAASFMADWDAA